MARHEVRISEGELAELIRRSSSSHPVNTSWGRGVLHIDDMDDLWMVRALKEIREPQRQLQRIQKARKAFDDAAVSLAATMVAHHYQGYHYPPHIQKCIDAFAKASADLKKVTYP